MCYISIMQKNIKAGLIWIISPFAGFIAVLLAWALVAFTAGSFMSESTSARSVLWFGYVNVGIGLMGILSIIAMPICLIIGLVYLLKKDPAPVEPQMSVEQVAVQSVPDSPLQDINNVS